MNVNYDFNQASDKPIEHELKILCSNSLDPNQVFDRVSFLSSHLGTRITPYLITSQRDDINHTLFNNGYNLRIRGNVENDIDDNGLCLTNKDICVKTEPKFDEYTKASTRFEFEANYDYPFSLNSVITCPLKIKYDLTNPSNGELNTALGLIKSPLNEIFRLSVNRTRFLLSFVSKSGFDVVGEMNIDIVKTMIGNKEIADRYTEIEFEIMRKPCQWNGDSSKVTDIRCTPKDISRIFNKVTDCILHNFPCTHVTNTSKSSRGYLAIK